MKKSKPLPKNKTARAKALKAMIMRDAEKQGVSRKFLDKRLIVMC